MGATESPLLWIGFIAGIVALLAIDLGVFHRRPHAITVKEAGVWSAIWIGLAALFALGVWYFIDGRKALEFATGYLIEKGLSVDNLFVFLVVFQAFAVPRELQHRVLFWGILGAIVMRGVFIGLGAALIERFEWILYLFGVLLVVTGIKLALRPADDVDPKKNWALRFFMRLLPSVPDYRGPAFFVREGGRVLATPLLFVLVVVETSDVMFATDSIPAIFAITRDPFIVFSSNILAILGLRALFFLLAGMLDQFQYLRFGLSAVLVFIGGKLLIKEWFHIPIALSLGVVILLIGGSMLISSWKSAHDRKSQNNSNSLQNSTSESEL